MQLLLHPSTTPRLTGNFRYRLWVKFEVTPEERSLITKYSVQRTILWRGRVIRDFARLCSGAPSPRFIVLRLSRQSPGAECLARPCYPHSPHCLELYCLGHLPQIREEVRVSDVLVGRFFSSPSVIALYDRERVITKAAIGRNGL